MIRFNHEANSWQSDFGIALGVWHNVSVPKARELFDKGFILIIH